MQSMLGRPLNGGRGRPYPRGGAALRPGRRAEVPQRQVTRRAIVEGLCNAAPPRREVDDGPRATPPSANDAAGHQSGHAGWRLRWPTTEAAAIQPVLPPRSCMLDRNGELRPDDGAPARRSAAINLRAGGRRPPKYQHHAPPRGKPIRRRGRPFAHGLHGRPSVKRATGRGWHVPVPPPSRWPMRRQKRREEPRRQALLQSRSGGA